VCTPLSSGFARLAYGAFYFAIPILTFYEIIRIAIVKIEWWKNIFPGGFGIPYRHPLFFVVIIPKIMVKQ
jgi:hypothetical protein